MASMPNSFLIASVHALQPCSRSHVVLARRSLSFWEVLEPLYLSLGISKVIMSDLGESVWLDLTVQLDSPMSGLFVSIMIMRYFRDRKREIQTPVRG